MKKKLLVIGLIFVSILIGGCTKSIDGVYNFLGDSSFNSNENELLELEIENNQAVITLNRWESSFFKGVTKEKEKIKGTIDSSKKVINFSSKNTEFSLSYTHKKDMLVLTDEYGETINFYSQNSKEFKKNEQEFELQDDDLTEDSQRNVSNNRDIIEEEEDYEYDNDSQFQKKDDLIEEYKIIEKKKSEELTNQLVKKISGNWISVEEFTSLAKIVTHYSFLENGQLNWKKEFLSDTFQGNVMLRLVFPNKRIAIDASGDKSDSVKDLSEVELEDLISDINSATLENYFEKFQQEDETYVFQVYDATGDKFNDTLFMKFPKSNSSIIQVTPADRTSSRMIDFVKE